MRVHIHVLDGNQCAAPVAAQDTPTPECLPTVSLGQIASAQCGASVDAFSGKSQPAVAGSARVAAEEASAILGNIVSISYGVTSNVSLCVLV